MKVTINKWGNSLGIRLPKSISKQFKLKDGVEIELTETKDGILLRKKNRIPTLDEIVKSYPNKFREAELFPNDLPSEQW